MLRLSRLTLLFALLFTVMIVSPALLSNQFGPYSLMKTGDVVDLLTPLILIPLYWLLFQLDPAQKPRQKETIAFLVLAAAWASGHGMHLAANSIGHLLQSAEGSDVYRLTYFYDEDLSHFIWHTGIIGLSALLIYRQWLHPFGSEAEGVGLVVAAGLLYGLTYFLTIIEAGTVVLGVPFAALVAVGGVVLGRDRFRQGPLLRFFFIAYLLATLLFAGWALYWGGLPEPSAVGLID